MPAAPVRRTAMARGGETILDFVVEDVDAEYERIDALGVEWVLRPTTQPWGRRSMIFSDPEGHLVNVFSRRGGGPMKAGPPAVEAENLVKTYAGDVQAVKGISFTVEAGEAFGLLGPNGAGKTTTIGMLNSTVKPTSGHARLGGRDVAEDPLGTRAISSVVFQDTVVDQPLTGRQNLELHLKLWGVRPARGSGPARRR